MFAPIFYGFSIPFQHGIVGAHAMLPLGGAGEPLSILKSAFACASTILVNGQTSFGLWMKRRLVPGTQRL